MAVRHSDVYLSVTSLKTSAVCSVGKLPLLWVLNELINCHNILASDLLLKTFQIKYNTMWFCTSNKTWRKWKENFQNTAEQKLISDRFICKSLLNFWNILSSECYFLFVWFFFNSIGRLKMKSIFFLNWYTLKYMNWGASQLFLPSWTRTVYCR